MKEKMLMRLERDRCLAKYELLVEQTELEKKNREAAEEGGSPINAESVDKPKRTTLYFNFIFQFKIKTLSW